MAPFFRKILIQGIIGKEKARALEDQHIDEYREKHGRNPRGNVYKTKKQREEESYET
jgi:hypothetical protein